MSEDYRILDVNDNRSFKKKIEAIIWCTEMEYNKDITWQFACWPSNRAPNSDFRIWFPRLSKKKNGEYIPDKNHFVNYLSDDWNYFYFDNLQEGHSEKKEDWYLRPDIIIAKDVDGDYVFRGVFRTDTEKSRPNHIVCRRIATKIKLIGKPVHSFELLDSTEDNNADDINKPIKPKQIITNPDRTISYQCARCYEFFSRNRRCPECGQLVKEK